MRRRRGSELFNKTLKACLLPYGVKRGKRRLFILHEKAQYGELITKRRHPIFQVEKGLMLSLFDIPPYGNVKGYKN